MGVAAAIWKRARRVRDGLTLVMLQYGRQIAARIHDRDDPSQPPVGLGLEHDPENVAREELVWPLGKFGAVLAEVGILAQQLIDVRQRGAQL